MIKAVHYEDNMHGLGKAELKELNNKVIYSLNESSKPIVQLSNE
jgi:hypothetical protein